MVGRATLECAIANGQHFVDEQDVRLEMRGDGEAESRVHAVRVALDRRVDEFARRPQNATISSKRARDVGARIPMIAPWRKTFSRPVRSG